MKKYSSDHVDNTSIGMYQWVHSQMVICKIDHVDGQVDPSTLVRKRGTVAASSLLLVSDGLLMALKQGRYWLLEGSRPAIDPISTFGDISSLP